MSASDLAPFVATVLRDGVVEDLHKENADLRQQLAAAEQSSLVASLSSSSRMVSSGMYYGGSDNDDYDWH